MILFSAVTSIGFEFTEAFMVFLFTSKLLIAFFDKLTAVLEIIFEL